MAARPASRLPFLVRPRAAYQRLRPRPLSAQPSPLLSPAVSSSRQPSLSLAASLRPFSNTSIRSAHPIPRPSPRPASSSTATHAGTPTSPSPPASNAAQERPNQELDPADGLNRAESRPRYRLSFTCLPCGTRSAHTVSKQGYHHGSVLITCPECHNRHVISDHLGIFGDRKITLEDLMREKGRLVKKGTLGVDEDVEFWEDDLASEKKVAEGEVAGVDGRDTKV